MKTQPIVNKIIISDVLGTLGAEYQINFLNYSQFTGNRVYCYRSGDTESYRLFLKDAKCRLPLKVHGQNSLLSWQQFCGEQYLSHCLKKYKQYPNGACILLRHHDFVEHISIGTARVDVNLFDLFNNHPNIKKKFISRVRNHINLISEISEPSYYIDDSISFSLKPAAKKTLSLKDFKPLIIGPKGPILLNKTELNCLVKLSQLKPAKEIANQLKLSVKTIETNIAKIKRKLSITNKSDLFKIIKNNQLDAFHFDENNNESIITKT